MNWESVSAFINMGGAGVFVWASYGVTAALIAVELIALGKIRRNTVRMLLRRQQLQAEQSPNAAGVVSV